MGPADDRPRQDNQLSIDVGGQIGAFVSSAFTLSGKVESFTESIDRDEQVLVTLVDADGSVIFRCEGWVKGVEVVTVPESRGVPRHSVRKHKIRLGEAAPE
jgi:hypothetical protein